MQITAEDEKIINILVVDDHPVVRFGVVSLLNAEPDFKVVGEVQNCTELCDQIADLDPDIVLLDMELEDSCGTDSLNVLREKCPGVKVIVFTGHDDEAHVIQAVRAGVQGYIVKGSSNNTLTEGIRRVNEGGSYFDPRIMQAVIHQLHSREAEAEQLTKRELLVLTEVGLGKPNKTIADHLGITVRTVKFHISSILSKLGAQNRTQAVKIAATSGLIKLN
jgi:DNA-binding NarL/FixJ family response regulator